MKAYATTLLLHLATLAYVGDCYANDGFHTECVTMYGGDHCETNNIGASYRPTCAGNCYVYPFNSLHVQGSMWLGTNCHAYYDTNCEYEIGSSGNVMGGEILFRKSKVRTKGSSRGWECILSHEFQTGITTGFCRGSKQWSDVSKYATILDSCISDLGHVMLLPLIMISSESSPSMDQKQRDLRDWLRRIEFVISILVESQDSKGHNVDELLVDPEIINRDLIDRQAMSVQGEPAVYLMVLDSIEEAAQLFMSIRATSQSSLVIKSINQSIK
ncbi:hypothetical protein PT974_01537 [Cladobotryum mycophilum]|uniref:Uncharacterized protein n=1 Tax=Cladobotryum mycophilum TaxID=491253 RepID=A0ABR0T400_9HYPO